MRLGRHRGKFCVIFTEDGKRRRRSLGTDDPATAQTRLGEFRRIYKQIDTGGAVGSIVAAYIEARTPEVSRPDRLKDAWKALKGTFDNLLPDHIDENVCRTYADLRAQKGRSMGTVHVELGMLRAAMRWGERKRLLDRVPDVWLPQKPGPKTHHLSREEARALIDAAVMPHMRLFIIVALTTAARAGAILDLRWERVDFKRGLVDLRDPEKGSTRKGRSTVPMNNTLRQALEEARAGALTPYTIEWAGRPVASIKKGFAAAVRRAGIEHCSPHTLRHTAAVWMAEGGKPMSEIAAYLGHSDSRTTERNYARYSPDYLRGAASALEI